MFYVTKKPFMAIENSDFQSPKNRIFPKGSTHAFGQKMWFFSLFVFGQNKTKNNDQSLFLLQKRE